MKILSWKINLENFYTEFISDMHLGSLAFNEMKFQERVNAIKRAKNRLWLGVGDYIDAIYPMNIEKRWDAFSRDRRYLTIDEQIEGVVKLFTPIKRKCLGLLPGNHELSYYRRTGFNPTAEIAKRLGVQELDSVNLITLVTPVRKVTIFIMHGSYAGRRIGGAINRLEEYVGCFEADVYVMAHTHFKGVWETSRLVVEEGKLKDKKILLGLTGSFYESYKQGVQTYSEWKALRPRRLGTITLAVIGKKLAWLT